MVSGARCYNVTARKSRAHVQRINFIFHKTPDQDQIHTPEILDSSESQPAIKRNRKHGHHLREA